MKKLTEAQIITIETWAKEKKKNILNDEERKIINHIETLSANNWEGRRIVNV